MDCYQARQIRQPIAHHSKSSTRVASISPNFDAAIADRVTRRADHGWASCKMSGISGKPTEQQRLIVSLFLEASRDLSLPNLNKSQNVWKQQKLLRSAEK
mmetsp:Transcript_14759/g.24004  ORF Transcript_14759/g.24004 Transcript_14759/m.24004 type:complete len:100 (-) Transcript_14759:230-529(-)